MVAGDSTSLPGDPGGSPGVTERGPPPEAGIQVACLPHAFPAVPALLVIQGWPWAEDRGVRLSRALTPSERIRAVPPIRGPRGKAEGQAPKLGVWVWEGIRIHSSGANVRAQLASPSSSVLLPELLSGPFGQRGWWGAPGSQQMLPFLPRILLL